MSLKIIRPGLLTSIQDSGRHGYQKIGVLVSGAMDIYSMRLSNMLVGNNENEGTIEITLLGPTIEFTADTLIAVTGGNFNPIIDGMPVPYMRPVAVKAGAVMKFSSSQPGCRAYLAAAGGFDVPVVMGSKSTYLRAGIGGFKGRSLQKNDILHTGNPNSFSQQILTTLLSRGAQSFAEARWFIGRPFSADNLHKPIRVTSGMHYKYFDQQSKYDFFSSDYLITNNADRMGYRLQGHPLNTEKPMEIISEAVGLGTIQVPPQGNPIILMADHQSVAGYPVIAQAITADTARIAQLKPNDHIRFKLISHEEAEQIFIEKEKTMENIKIAIKAKLQN
ncbi:5-oxoprolinase subunit C family protein [Pectinatus sottacetonis]|uniref:5-oxoprolinase subunit C family protein n=1 Tax=Pectinatus sottacetonis TaxID=1002795 RepID=UPI0018C7EB66|nr:biotin-dependent carboxyltransferase family protein [Pectinatus sottacetonis]